MATLSPRRLTGARLRRGLAALGLFILWSAVVQAGVVQGSRKSAWIQRPFGVWPESVESVTGTSDIQLSIFVSLDDGGTSGASDARGGILGLASVGRAIDSHDSNNINGSRFVTGIVAGNATAISVYVGGPVDIAPNDQFELAVYSDNRGAPDRLLALTGPGTLVADAWNSRPLALGLEPNTAYWLMYNTNGTNASVNNPTFNRVVANPIDAVIRSWDIPNGRQLADRIAVVGNLAPTTVLLLVFAASAVRSRPKIAVALVASFVLALLVAYVLRETLFAPYGLYPSGHALRMAVLTAAVGVVLDHWAPRYAFGVATLAVCVAAILGGGHYTEELLGGVLLGWGVTVVLCALVERAPAASTEDRGPAADPNAAEDTLVLDLRDRVPANLVPTAD